jgi:hypothetical protein
VCGAWKSCVVNKPVSGTNKLFFCARLYRIKAAATYHESVTQAKRQHVLFGRCLLADIALQALRRRPSHWNRTAYWRHKVAASCAPFYAILSPNWPLWSSCVAKKISSAVNQKHPGFGHFSPSPFKRRFALF